MINLAIFGGSGGGTIVMHTVRRLAAGGQAIRICGFLNDVLLPKSKVLGIPVLGAFESWRDLPDHTIFLAPLHKAKEMQNRAARIHGLKIEDARWATIIDPAAAIADDATIKIGSFVGPFALLDTAVQVGSHALLLPAAQIGHESVIEDFVFVGRGSIISGRCHVAIGAHIGPGSVVRDRLRVGRFAVVGAGSVIIRDVPDYAIVAGNPARLIGNLSANDDSLWGSPS